MIAIARELGAGIRIQWDDLAAANWGEGCRTEKTAAEHMRDLFGCTDYSSPHRMEYRAHPGKTHTLVIPKKFEKTGYPVDQSHTIRVIYKETQPQFRACRGIPNITFRKSSSFIRPSAEKHLADIKDILDKNSDAKLIIFGHTDGKKPVGHRKTLLQDHPSDETRDEETRKGLSERRAKSAYALLTRKPDLWFDLYKTGKAPDSENWGVHSIQVILNYLNPDAKLDLTDYLDERTIKEIETHAKPASEGTVDGYKRIPENTVKKIFTLYMDKLLKGFSLDDSRFVPLKHTGCGCFNPVIDPEWTDDENRRATFFLFDTKRMPVFPCSNTDIEPCRGQSAQYRKSSGGTFRWHHTFSCAFYDSIARDCDCEASFPDIIAIDSHMHFMTGHATPLPFMCGQFPWKLKKARFKRNTLDGFGKLPPVVGVFQLAHLAAQSTTDIATMGFDQNNVVYNRIYSNALSRTPKPGLLTPMIAMPMDMSFAHIDGYNGKPIYTKVLTREYYCRSRLVASDDGNARTEIVKYTEWPKAVTDILPDAERVWSLPEPADEEKWTDYLKNSEANAGIYTPEKAIKATESRGHSDQVKEGFYYYFTRKNAHEVAHSVKDKVPRWTEWQEIDLFVDWDDQYKDTITEAVKHPFQYIPMFHYDPRRWMREAGYMDFSDPGTDLIADYPWGWDIPFKDIATVDKPGVFIGFKMYTELGYRPADYDAWGSPRKKRLPHMEEFYRRCRDEGIPVLCHCSEGGVFSHERELYYDLEDEATRREYERRGWFDIKYWPDRKKDWYYDKFVSPAAWEPVLEKFPTLKLCLAHFGGGMWEDWHSKTQAQLSKYTYGLNRTDNKTDENEAIQYYFDRKENGLFSWIRQIVDLMEKKKDDLYCHPNFYTDISYHFMEKHSREFLWLIVNHPIVKERVLFGTDWYMTEGSKLTNEKFVTNAKTAIDQLSRDYYQKTGIDEDLWMTFSRVNPMKFYGLRSLLDNYKKGIEEALDDIKSPIKDIDKIRENITANHLIIKNSDL